LLRPGPRGPHALDADVTGGRAAAARPGDARLRGDGAAGAKKTDLQPWRKQSWCIPEKDAARFVAQREDVLDVYVAAHTPEEPLICMDEASKQLLRDARPGQPAVPGRPARADYHYERRGVQALFLFVDPLRGWRRVSGRDSRTRSDWAAAVKLVCDNLNRHGIAALYEAFPAAEAHRLARRLEIHDTPRSGSWLNVAEIELAVLSRQCLDRRSGSAEELQAETAAGTRARNADAGRVEGRFTTEDARTKLRHLYPQI
jgi:DDE superfamily endonuclease